MAAKKEETWWEKLKDSLKIKKRGPTGANAELLRKRGRTLKSKTAKTKMASFREDTKANQQLQKETKDPTTKYTTYTKVSSKNKANLSDQHLVKSKAGTKSNTGTKKKKYTARDRMRAQNVKIHGEKRIKAVEKHHKAWKAARKKKKG